MSTNNDTTSEHRWNCLNCRRRKVRCDRHWPCSHCVKGRRECVFPTSGRSSQRLDVRPRSPRSRQAELMDRIRRLEGLVDGLSTELADKPESNKDEAAAGEEDSTSRQGVAQFPGSLPPVSKCEEHTPAGDAPSPLPSRALTGSKPDSGNPKAVLYAAERFWDLLRREVQQVRESFDGYEDDETDVDDSSYASSSIFAFAGTTSSTGSHFVFSNGSSPEGDTRDQGLPTPSQMLFIWQTYVEDVHPFVQILHLPTVGKIIHERRGGVRELGVEMQALMAAISLAAIRTLSDEEVRLNFNREASDLVRQLRSTTERALARADYINTTSMEVIQALVIYVFIIATLDTARYTWSMIGLLQRIAFAVDLHKDGARLPGISLFDAEMRRRLWWHICLIESRIDTRVVAPPVLGFNIAERHFDTREPANVNDADLDPAMTTPPVPREGLTDTSLTLMRCEIWRMAQVVSPVVSKICAGQGGSLDDIERKLDTLRRLSDRLTHGTSSESDSPMHRAIVLMSSVRANSWELMINHLICSSPHTPRSAPSANGAPSLAQKSKEKSFDLAVALLHDYSRFQHDPTLERWSWLHRGLVHWQSLAITFSGIAARPWDAASEEAWTLARVCLDEASDAVRADTRWRSLGQLAAAAGKHRARELRARGSVDRASASRSQGTSAGTVVGSETTSPVEMGSSIEVEEQFVPESYDTDAETSIPRLTALVGNPTGVAHLIPEPRSYPMERAREEEWWGGDMMHGLPEATPVDLSGAGDVMDLVDWREMVQMSGQCLLWGNESI